MAAKPSMTGVTPRDWRTDATPGTGTLRTNGAQAQEAERLLRQSQGQRTSGGPAPAPTQSAAARRAAGTKVSGATRTSGGAI